MSGSSGTLSFGSGFSESIFGRKNVLGTSFWDGGVLR